MKITFNKKSLLIALSLFFIECLIALYFNSGFIRETVGDFLVIILLYYCLKSFIKTNPFYLAITTLAFAFTVEFSQLFQLLERLELQDSKALRLILGTTFSFSDLITYTIGCITIITVEYKTNKLWID